MRWVTDPEFDDHDLLDYLCGPSAPPNMSAACPTLRNCTWDPALGADGSLNATCSNGCFVCEHKAFWPPESGDYLTGAIMFVCGTLAGASGIGGGGLNVPVLMLSGGFLVSEAVPLSHMAVLGNAVAQNLINAPRRHPHSRARALIDLDVALLMLPAQLGGNTLGVLLSPALPSTGVETLACVLLAYAALKTVVAASKALRRERAEALAREAATSVGSPDSLVVTATKRLLTNGETLSAHPLPEEAQHDAPSATAAASSSADDSLTATLPPRGSVLHPNLCVLVLLWLCVVLLFVGAHRWGGTHMCAPRRLVWLLAQLAIVVGAAIGGALRLRYAQAARDDAAVPLLPGDQRWSARNTTLLPCAGALVGCVAGLLGLGGGELMAPLLLAIGMLPQVASATSACMVLFTSSSNVAHYVFTGVLTPDPGYVTAAAAVGFASALIGRLLALRLVRTLSHPSLIAFTLAAVLVVALGLLAVQMSRQRVDWSFASLCR